MSSPTLTAEDPNLWLYFRLNGYISPGTIPRGGVKGFKRETGWDVKKGKGTKGSILTLVTQPPVEGTFTLQLIGPGGFNSWGTSAGGLGIGSSESVDFALWDNFVLNVLSINPAVQQTIGGLNIFYPGLSAIGLNHVLIKNYSGPEHVGKGLYNCTIEMIEWGPPTQTNITQTPSTVSPDEGDDRPAQVDPEEAALQAQIAAAQQGATP